AAGREQARCAQADRHLASGPDVGGDCFATHSASRAALRTPDMTLIFACEVVLAGLLVAIATWTIVARTAFAAIVLFMVYGLLLAIVWVALSAVDVPLTEPAIGGGFTSMLLLVSATRLRSLKPPVADVSLPLKMAAGLLCALVTTVLGAVVFFLPDVGPTLAPVARDNLAASGLGNPVAAVLFVFRALDTL